MLIRESGPRPCGERPHLGRWLLYCSSCGRGSRTPGGRRRFIHTICYGTCEDLRMQRAQQLHQVTLEDGGWRCTSCGITGFTGGAADAARMRCAIPQCYKANGSRAKALEEAMKAAYIRFVLAPKRAAQKLSSPQLEENISGRSTHWTLVTGMGEICLRCWASKPLGASGGTLGKPCGGPRPCTARGRRWLRDPLAFANIGKAPAPWRAIFRKVGIG